MANDTMTDNKPVLGTTIKGNMGSPSSAVNAYVSNGMKLIHSVQTRDNIIQQLKSIDDPATAVAQTAVNVLEQMDRSASQSGVQVPNDVRLQGSAPILEQIIEIGEASGAVQLSDEQIKQAAGMAASLYIKKKMDDNTITMDDLTNLYNSFQQEAMKEQKGGKSNGR